MSAVKAGVFLPVRIPPQAENIGNNKGPNRKWETIKLSGTDITLEKDFNVLINVMSLHQNSQYYPEPDTFNPENFSKENKAKRHP